MDNQKALNMEQSHVEQAVAGDKFEKAYTWERRKEARGRDVAEVPAGYWYSPEFIGSYCVGCVLLIQIWYCGLC